MFLLHLFLSFLVIIASSGQFLPLSKHKLLKVKQEVPLHVDYQERLDDCPNKYYKYGGATLTSSLAFDVNHHHFLSHYVLVGEVPGVALDQMEKFEPKCVGILISNKWTLITGDCVKMHENSLNTIGTGVDIHGVWTIKELFLTRVERIVKHKEFALVESQEIK